MEQIIQASEEYLDKLTMMGMDLWPGHDYRELKLEFNEYLKSNKINILLYMVDREPAAFIYLSIRIDYVEGSSSSPTGYIEGIYVKPEYRRKGISRSLFHEGRKWFLKQGCRQVGSDIRMDNKVSYNFHKSIGFKESGRIITFIQDM